jgi:hypothetical protein
MDLIRTHDVSQYFELINNQWIFKGNKLEVYIPKIYQERKLLTIGEIASSLGIFQIRINDAVYANFLFLGKLNIEFTSYKNVTEDGFKYIVLELIKDSVFISNSQLVKNGNLLYEIFVMFLAYGKIPPFLNYDEIYQLFDYDQEHCGINLKVNHSIFEMIYAHIFRDAKDPYKFYRHTLMDKPPIIVPLHQISHGPISTTSRIMGGYLSEGITSALVDENTHVPSTIENLLRG